MWTRSTSKQSCAATPVHTRRALTLAPHSDPAARRSSALYDPAVYLQPELYYNTSDTEEISATDTPYGFFHRTLPGYPVSMNTCHIAAHRQNMQAWRVKAYLRSSISSSMHAQKWLTVGAKPATKSSPHRCLFSFPPPHRKASPSCLRTAWVRAGPHRPWPTCRMATTWTKRCVLAWACVGGRWPGSEG